MARPSKSNADYFRHDNDMRNDPKVRALRGKFGLEGYAVWSMILETLTDADDFFVPWNTLSIELFAGDFGLDSERLTEVVAYMTRLNLVQIEGETLRCQNLSNRLQSVIEKREMMHKRYNRRVSAAEMTHSIVEESRVEDKKKKELDDVSREAIAKKAFDALNTEKEKKSSSGAARPALRPIAEIAAENPAVQNTYTTSRRLPPERFGEMVLAFDTEAEALNGHYHGEGDLIKHFLNYAANKIRIEQETKTRPVRSAPAASKSTITQAGRDAEHYRKPQAF